MGKENETIMMSHSSFSDERKKKPLTEEDKKKIKEILLKVCEDYPIQLVFNEEGNHMSHIRKSLEDNLPEIEKELFYKGSVYLDVKNMKVVVHKPDNLVIMKRGKVLKEISTVMNLDTIGNNLHNIETALREQKRFKLANIIRIVKRIILEEVVVAYNDKGRRQDYTKEVDEINEIVSAKFASAFRDEQAGANHRNWLNGGKPSTRLAITIEEGYKGKTRK